MAGKNGRDMNPKAKILIVDDDAHIRRLLADRLSANDYSVVEAEDGSKGLAEAGEQKPDLVLLDLQMPGMDGFAVLDRMREKFPDLPVVIMTAYGSIERAVEALKRGAYDFLPKPCKPDHILLVINKALERRELMNANAFLRQEMSSQYQMIQGSSPEMKKVMDIAHKVAPSRTTVLIQGESGTGKQLMARCIHNISDRKERPFIQVNCTVLSEHLIESDLFGHEKGAFTGAIKQKKGRFEMANSGTIFLDEIGELSPTLQAKLLHVLEYGEFQRVGGIESLRTDVRIIAATNKDLHNEVEQGRFREDLFYRLNVVNITMLPLRSRIEDIPLFIEHFLYKHARAMGKSMDGISADAMKSLTDYSWPGNIRELENVIERAAVLASGKEITTDLLPPLLQERAVDEIAVGAPLEQALLQFKKTYIARTLKAENNNQTQAARILDVQRTYLNRLIKELGIKTG